MRRLLATGPIAHAVSGHDCRNNTVQLQFRITLYFVATALQATRRVVRVDVNGLTEVRRASAIVMDLVQEELSNAGSECRCTEILRIRHGSEGSDITCESCSSLKWLFMLFSHPFGCSSGGWNEDLLIILL